MIPNYPAPVQEEDLFEHLLESPPSHSTFFEFGSAPDLKNQDNETDLWILKELEYPISEGCFSLVEELDSVKEARKGQSREIYQFL